VSSPVPQRPTPARLLSRRVGRPLSASHGRRWAQEVNFNLCFATQNVASYASTVIHPIASTGEDVAVLYRRSPSVRVLRVSIALHPSTTGINAPTRGTLSLWYGTSLSALTRVALVGDGDTGPLGGVLPVALPVQLMRVHDDWVVDIDVSAWPTSSTHVLLVRFTPQYDTAPGGIARVTVVECPLADTSPVAAPLTTGEPGLNESEADPRNRIYAGNATSVGGTARMFREMDRARTEVRRHLQVTAPLGTYSHYRNGTTIGALYWSDATGIADTWDPTFVLRARKLYGSTGANRYRAWVVYRYQPTYSDVTLSFVRVTVSTAATGGATTNTADIPVVDTGAGYALASALVDVPCDGTNGLARATFAARTSNTDGVNTTSDLLRIGSIALIEEES